MKILTSDTFLRSNKVYLHTSSILTYLSVFLTKVLDKNFLISVRSKSYSKTLLCAKGPKRN